MNYNCQKLPIDRLPVLAIGLPEPLCNSCITKDCDNPIEPIQVSVFGIIKVQRVYNVNGKPSYVLECDGYINKNNSQTQRDTYDIQSLSKTKENDENSSTANGASS